MWFLYLAALIATLLPLYLLVVRPWQLRWGATEEEVARDMPGDLVVAAPTFAATRAVTIEARPEEIWPWLVQIGFGRAGWYSYDWVDNLGRPSARRILPEFQGLKAGDLVPIYKDRGFRVKELMPGQYMLWADDEGRGNLTWIWALYPLNQKQSRLVTRVRLRFQWLSPVILFHLAIELGDIIMMRKCMLGIKERVESKAA